MKKRLLRGNFHLAIIASLIGTPTFAQVVNQEDFCPVLENHAPANAEFCLANFSPAPTDSSYVLVARATAKVKVFLIRFDLPSGGSCAPPVGASRAYYCAELEWAVAPDFDAVCGFAQTPWECDNGQMSGWRFKDGSGTTVGGANQAVSEQYFAAARGLTDGDVQVREIGDSVVFKRADTAKKGVPLRILDSGMFSSILTIRPEAAKDAALRESIARIQFEGIQLSHVSGLGTEGRFIELAGGNEIFHGTVQDCDGQCQSRELLTEADFEAVITRLGGIVEIEDDTLPVSELRKLLIDKMLLGSANDLSVSDKLDEVRFRQDPALVLFNW